MSAPICYQRGDGKIRWQPTAGGARRVWYHSYATIGEWEKEWDDRLDTFTDTAPVVYRSKARAERIGRREEKRRAKEQMMQIKECEP